MVLGCAYLGNDFPPWWLCAEKRDSLFVVLLCLNYSHIKSQPLPNVWERAGCTLEAGWKWEGDARGWTLIGELVCVWDPTAGFASSDTGNEFVLWKKSGPLCGENKQFKLKLIKNKRAKTFLFIFSVRGRWKTLVSDRCSLWATWTAARRSCKNRPRRPHLWIENTAF